MATISLSYNKKTLKAIRDAKEKKNITTCATFEDYLKAVEIPTNNSTFTL